MRSLLFLVPAFIWGTTWLVIKFQLGTVPPEVSVVYRFGLASLVLFVWGAARRVPLRLEPLAHLKVAVLGILQFGVVYVLVYFSERRLTSGLIAVVFALVVFWNILGARVFLGAKLHPLVAVGAGIGFAGIVLVFSPELAHFRGAPEEQVGLVLAVMATFSTSAANLWSQRLFASGLGVVSSTAWGMFYASLSVAAYCIFSRIPFALDVSFAYLASLAYLALLGSVVAFICYLTLLHRIGAARSGYIAVVIPVLAMIASTFAEGFRWSIAALFGMSLVAAGSLIVLRARQLPQEAR